MNYISKWDLISNFILVELYLYRNTLHEINIGTVREKYYKKDYMTKENCLNQEKKAA